MEKIRVVLTQIVFFVFFTGLQIAKTQGSPSVVSINGEVTSFAVSGKNIIAGTRNNGIYVSGNNGASWTAANNGLPASLNVISLNISDNIFFIGTNQGIYFSENNGNNWTVLNMGIVNPHVYSIVVRGADLFAGTEKGIYFSGNNGTTWVAVDPAFAPTNFTSSFALSCGKTLAGTNQGVFHSENNGASWTEVKLPRINTFAEVGMAIIAGSGAGVFMSMDEGTSWTAANYGLTNHNVLSFAVYGSGIFAGTALGVFFSNNNGNNWIAIDSTHNIHNIAALAVNGNKLFVSGMAGFSGSSQVYEIDITSVMKNLEISDKEMLLIPNPSEGCVSIEWENKENLVTEVIVTNIQGEEVYRNKNNIENRLMIDLGNPAIGIYFMQLKNEKGVLRRKFVVK
jgi:photosystem II stability/assembly factor-like uncharacterized protein